MSSTLLGTALAGIDTALTRALTQPIKQSLGITDAVNHHGEFDSSKLATAYELVDSPN